MTVWKPTGLDPSFLWDGDLFQRVGTAAVSGTYGNWHNARHVASKDNVGFLRGWAAFLLHCKEVVGPVLLNQLGRIELIDCLTNGNIKVFYRHLNYSSCSVPAFL